MDRNELLVKTAAIVATLAETNGAPESHLYIFLGMDMGLWERLRDILVKAKMIQIQHHFVTLTESGKSVADKLK